MITQEETTRAKLDEAEQYDAIDCKCSSCERYWNTPCQPIDSEDCHSWLRSYVRLCDRCLEELYDENC